MWLLDGQATQTASTLSGFFTDLWHSFLVFLAMFFANHASGNNGSNKQ